MTPDEPRHDSADAQPIAHFELKASLLLALMVALVGGFIAYVMVARGVFESTQQLVLMADDSEGIRVGMDLTFSGFPIGRVHRIELADDGKARILIAVPSKDAHRLRSSSVFTVERGMVGDTRMRAFSGILTDPPLEDGAVRSVLRGDATAGIPHLIASTKAILENLQQMSGPDSSLNASLGNLQTVTERMKGRYGALGGALGSDANARKVIAALDHTNLLLTKTDERIFGPQGVMDETRASIVQLNAVLGEARQSLKRVDAVLAEAQAVGANARVATSDLGVLREEVDASLRKVTQLVDEINRKWPFARDATLKLP